MSSHPAIRLGTDADAEAHRIVDLLEDPSADALADWLSNHLGAQLRYFELPDATRAALLIAALDDGTELAEILFAASLLRHEPLTVDALAPAEAAHLIDLSPTEVRFRHPLMRSAVQPSATLADRVAGHTALAGALEQDLDPRAWHRASAVIGRSEDVASDLDALAARARDRGAGIVSIAAEARSAGDANLAWNLLWRLAQRCFWADPGPDARGIVVRAAEQAESANRDARAVAVLAYSAPIEGGSTVIDRGHTLACAGCQLGRGKTAAR